MARKKKYLAIESKSIFSSKNMDRKSREAHAEKKLEKRSTRLGSGRGKIFFCWNSSRRSKSTTSASVLCDLRVKQQGKLTVARVDGWSRAGTGRLDDED